MKDWTISTPLRLLFLFIATVLWTGIWLTGFEQVHSILYVPALFLAFAGITGICPGLIITRLVTSSRGVSH